MKTAVEVQERIDSLQESYNRLEDQLGQEESLELIIDMEVIEAKINSLKWVLQVK